MNHRNLFDASKSTETNNSKSPIMRPGRGDRDSHHLSTQSKGSPAYLNPKQLTAAPDLASCIYMPTTYEQIRNKKEISEVT